MIPVSLAALRRRAGFVCSLTLAPVLLPTDVWAQTATRLDPVEISPTAPAKPKRAIGKRSASAARSKPKPAAGGGASPSAASQQDAATTSALNLKQDSATGSRLNLTPLETPASVESISAQTISERGQHNLIDAVTQNATGITATPQPGNGSVSFTSRGFSGVNSVMTLYDGTRFYPASGTITFPFDTWSAERIDVLRGPASVLYGQGAIGGVINVIPKKPLDVQHNEAELSLDTNLTRRLSVDSGGPINPNVTYRLAATGNMSDGWVDRDKTSNLAISAAVRLQAADNLAFTFSNDYSDRKPSRYFGTPLINGMLDDALRFKNYNAQDSNIRYQDNWTQFKTEWDVSDSVTVRNTMYALTSHRQWRDIETYAFNPATRMIDRSDYIQIFHDQTQVGNRMDATIRGHLFGFKNETVVGFDVNRIAFTHTNNGPDYAGASSVDPYNFNPGSFFDTTSPTALGFRSVTNQYSAFAEDRLTLSDQLTVVSGVNFDQPTITRTDYRNPANSFETSLSGTSWRTGVVYTPIKDLAFYSQYTVGADPVSTLITTSASQKDFKLTTGKQVEVGVKQSFWNGRGEWTLAGYQIVKNDLLAVDPIHPTIVQQVGQQSSRGLEASLGLVLNYGWRLDANLALLRAKYDDNVQSVGGVLVNYAGNVPTNVPQQVSNIWATWDFAPNWSVNGGVQIVGKTYADSANTVAMPSYTVVNAGLRWKPDAKTTVTLRVYNLFDKVYAASGDPGQWLLGMPRTAELSVNVKF